MNALEYSLARTERVLNRVKPAGWGYPDNSRSHRRKHIQRSVVAPQRPSMVRLHNGVVMRNKQRFAFAEASTPS